MRRVIGLLPGGQVASGISAVVRLDGQIVIVVDVAVGAGVHLARGRHLVRIRQRKTGRAVIEGGRGTGDRVVAGRAVGCRKRCSGSRVRRVIGVLPGGQVALRVPAIGRLEGQGRVID